MKIFNVIEIKKVAKEVKPMTCEEADLAVDGVAADDTPVKEKKSKKKLGRRVLGVAGAFGAGFTTAYAVLRHNGGDPDEEESGADAAEDPAPSEAADGSETY